MVSHPYISCMRVFSHFALIWNQIDSLHWWGHTTQTLTFTIPLITTLKPSPSRPFHTNLAPHFHHPPQPHPHPYVWRPSTFFLPSILPFLKIFPPEFFTSIFFAKMFRVPWLQIDLIEQESKMHSSRHTQPHWPSARPRPPLLDKNQEWWTKDQEPGVVDQEPGVVDVKRAPSFRPIYFGPTFFCPIHFIQS